MCRSREGIRTLAEGIISLAQGAREEDEDNPASVEARASALVIAEAVLKYLHTQTK